MRLSAFVSRLDVRSRRGPIDVDVQDVTADSRAVRRGSLYAAVAGTRVDGHAYIEAALTAGASVVLLSRWPEGAWPEDVVGLEVVDPRRGLGHAASALLGDPSQHLAVLGITGTNGKTSTVAILEAILAVSGLRVGAIGTTGIRWSGHAGDVTVQATHTTPDAPALQALLARMRADGVQAVAMELSSHALEQRRLAGLALDVGGWSNLTRDHLDYHGSMEAYGAAKGLMLTELLAGSPKSGRAVLNIDDAAVAAWVGRWPDTLTVSSQPGALADIAPVAAPEFGPTGIRARVKTPIGVVALSSSLLGAHNLANLLLAGGLAVAFGVGADALAAGWAAAPAARGRMERVEAEGADGPVVVVDYAHTPDAIATVLASLRPFVRGRIVTVFGCGGDRDAGKRPLMAAAAWAGSDNLVITSDNPRTEDPDAILDAIAAGLPRGAVPASTLPSLDSTPCARITDRRGAIEAAIAAASASDLVLIAGKGHEMTQDINGRKVPFDDREEARRALLSFHAPANEPPAGYTRHGRSVRTFPPRDDRER